MQGQGVKGMARTSKETKRAPLPKGVRIILKAIRLLLFPTLLVVGLYVGLRAGYVRFGGGDPDDVLRWETWKHMYDLVFADP